jgi:hypothetical protein
MANSMKNRANSRNKSRPKNINKDAENSIKKCMQANPRNKDGVNFWNKGRANSGEQRGKL